MPRILVVEDELILREQIIETLTYEEYEVLSAENGQVGLELARSSNPDLIISDIMMPVLDGYGLLLALREDESTSTIPFIFLTAKADYADVRGGMSYGADDYLVKPFDVRDLLTAIQARLNKQARFLQQGEKQLDRLRYSVVSSLPHELRTPLTIIMGYMDLIMNDYEATSKEKIYKMLVPVQKSADRLYRLIQNYLLFTQLEIVGLSAERLALLETYLDLTPSNPKKIAVQAATDRAKSYNRMDDLIIDVVDSNVEILPEDLLKVVSELTDNAFKFSSAKSPVVITGKPEGAYFRLSIVDSGRGLRPDQVKQIGAMVQFDRERYEQQGGGLGLILAQRLVELYGGQFLIESQLGHGCSVTLLLKLAPLQPKSESDSARN